VVGDFQVNLKHIQEFVVILYLFILLLLLLITIIWNYSGSYARTGDAGRIQSAAYSAENKGFEG
jgi:hypothetical protein